MEIEIRNKQNKNQKHVIYIKMSKMYIKIYK